MHYLKKILIETKNYKITYHENKSTPSNKCVITFGEVDSPLDETGFADKLIMDQGFDYIYVAQKKFTHYQFLSAEKFKNVVHKYVKNKEVYTYGSSLGAYSAIYYGGMINANILAMSPRIPAHPVIDNLMDQRFKNRGFKHKDLSDLDKSNKNVCIFYDEKNHIDSYYVNFFIKEAYPNASYYNLEAAGHYTARALLLSGELKNVALSFFSDQEIDFELDYQAIYEWQYSKAKSRIRKGKLGHAEENISALLSNDFAKSEDVQNLITEYKAKLLAKSIKKSKDKTKKIHPIMTQQEKDKINQAVIISYVGDLILLRDQVLNSYNFETNQYEFDEMFTHVKKYLSISDFNMGVFEGVTAGDGLEYSTSDYKDNIPVKLNFPDRFAYAIKQAGFDFVTTAQNHFLDYGVDGARRTLDTLDKVGLNHRGSYRNQEEKDQLPIYHIKGLKVAILTYTRNSNGYKNSFFLDNENKHLTSLIVSPKDENFEKVKQDVISDFERVKKENPDCIIVHSHIGKQFVHEPDKSQKIWADIFVDAGANVVLNDHAHAVQPYEWRKSPKDGSSVLILHCPGNFVNSYIDKNGDASALSQIYLDPKTGKPFSVGCVPLWAHAYIDGNYRALPVHDVMNDRELRKTISVYEFNRIKEVQELVTGTMLGEKISIDQMQEQYYLMAERANKTNKGYVRSNVQPLELSKEVKKNKIYNLMKKSKKVTFVGDSLTEGTKNGGYGWFEPLIENFKEVEYNRFSKDGLTAKSLVKYAGEVAENESDLFVIAIGANDVRYRDPKLCTMTKEEYIKNIDQLVSAIQTKNKKAKFVFIAPWTTDNFDKLSKLPKVERFKMLKEYSDELKAYANSINSHYINPNVYIKNRIKTRNPKTWLLDSIHPNAGEGIKLYSEAVIEASSKESAFIRRAIKKVIR
ncbi:CapA family protein [Halalkalibacillus halophilus]|uniref:CapA family protein n=1 Tax=Halalkalibacillus halophilus TaxID=392827 RepID=UPI0004072E48|nr:CapA family protein [Halalkalibacillus halophilus]